jgi:hypothetical protein
MPTRRPAWAALLALVLLVSSAPAFAQGSASSSITGTVADPTGGVIPGATVVVATESGTSFTTVTNAEGAFSFASMTAGTYTVTVTLQGFKTAVVNNVRLLPNLPTDLKVTLEVGALQETVVVASSAELINTQTATVASTLNADQLNRMPTATRNALNAVTFLPGVNTATTNRNSNINGLPDSMINITLDGVSNNDNFLRSSDGFFASVTPRQDAVEAVTVTTAVAGANQGGSGAVTISFITRSGTNQFSGSAYEYFRHPDLLNSNYFFNERNGLPKNDVRLHQYGGRVGGPIRLPGLYDGSGKAFYFFHYEQLRFPNSFTRTRGVFVPQVLNGDFLYEVSGATRTVNVLDVARANGQLATVDPTVMRVLTNIQGATQSGGVLNPTSDVLFNSFVWQSPGRLFEHQPTLKVDYNLGANHRLSGSMQAIWAERDPDYLNSADARFPGAPNYRVFRSTRPLYSIAMRSTLSANVVNELRGGFTAVGGAGSRFGQPDDPSNGRESFADQDFFAIGLPFDNDITEWWTTNGPSWRAAPTINIDESLSWLKGNHNFNLGGSFIRSSAWENAQQIVPGIGLGFNTQNDPANSMFNTTNFPGASSGDLNDARAIYAMLTGRISSITGQAALDPATNRYVAFGPRRREGYINVISAFAQDSWRVTPTLTLNYGLRYDVQTPFVALNDTMSAVTMESICGMSGPGDGGIFSKCNFFSPGTDVGVVPEFIQYNSGTKGYDTDWNNIGPSVSVAWRPNVEAGWLRALLGDPETATLRAGYAENFERVGLSDFTGQFGSNPGSTLSLSRTAAIGNLVNPGEAWPILLSERDRLAPASFPETPTFPIAVRAGRADSLNAFAPDIKIASARSWTVGFQRSITQDMAVEIRYVGTRGVNQWSELNYNERDILANGFFDEFQLAVQNLQANNAAGGSRAGSFAFFGPGTGTNPLPIFLAYLNGRTTADNPASYTGSNWTSSGITQDMVFVRPEPFNSASDLDGSATFRANAITAGLPANFFVLNPAVNGANVIDSGAFSDYHALQIEMRRRLSRNLSANINYQFAVEGGSSFLGFRHGRVMDPSENVRHAIKSQWDWTIPVGRGERFGANLPGWLDGLVGGWSFNGVGRVQARSIDFGNVRLVGMTADELQDMWTFDIRVDPVTGLQNVFMLPDDVILNTRRAFSTSPTSPTGYGSLGVPEGKFIAPANSENCIELRDGDCAPRSLMLRAPWFVRFDIGFAKRIALQGRTNVEIRFDLLNALNNINFNPVANPGSGGSIFQTTSAYQDPSNTFDPGGRLGQLMVRFNW